MIAQRRCFCVWVRSRCKYSTRSRYVAWSEGGATGCHGRVPGWLPCVSHTHPTSMGLLVHQVVLHTFPYHTIMCWGHNNRIFKWRVFDAASDKLTDVVVATAKVRHMLARCQIVGGFAGPFAAARGNLTLKMWLLSILPYPARPGLGD